jgi:hypothetical protein
MTFMPVDFSGEQIPALITVMPQHSYNPFWCLRDTSFAALPA